MHRNQFACALGRRGARIHRGSNCADLSPHKDRGVAPASIFLPCEHYMRCF
jgi:hypothetical protein